MLHSCIPPAAVKRTEMADEIHDELFQVGEGASALRSARAFKYATMAVLLVITVASALLPLYVARHGSAASQGLLSRKLPFATAGVFLGSGLLHLLPDSVKLWDKLLLGLDAPPAPWMTKFPVMYFLGCLGCAVVWSIDLLNMGNSGKMMAVASAARPDYETSMYRVQIPSVASYGARLRTVSDDGKWRFSSCSCGEVASPSLFHKKTARSEEGSYLLTRNGVQLVNRANEMQYPTATVAADCETQALLHNEPDADAEGAVSEHIVFSGDSNLLPYLLAALFSVHSLIAGFALGVNRVINSTAVATAVAIFSHKFIEAMAVGANFARAKTNIAQRRSVAVLTLYSCMTPLGIFLGMVLSASLQGPSAFAAEAVALSFASGSFIYLAFHELSEENADQESGSLEKILLFSAGLTSMAALAVWA